MDSVYVLPTKLPMVLAVPVLHHLSCLEITVNANRRILKVVIIVYVHQVLHNTMALAIPVVFSTAHYASRTTYVQHV